GGKSTSMVHDSDLMNPLGWWGNFDFSPARRVVNALAISYQSAAPSAPSINAWSYTGVNMPTPVQVTLGTDQNQGSVKVQCASLGSNYEQMPFDSSWQPSGSQISVPMKWTTPGSKTIYCTTFDQAKQASSVTSRNIQVAQVDSISPSMPKLNQF